MSQKRFAPLGLVLWTLVSGCNPILGIDKDYYEVTDASSFEDGSPDASLDSPSDSSSPQDSSHKDSTVFDSSLDSSTDSPLEASAESGLDGNLDDSSPDSPLQDSPLESSPEDTGPSEDSAPDSPSAPESGPDSPLCSAPGGTYGGASLVWLCPQDNDRFGIDSTEVTQGQYQAWLDTNPSTGSQFFSACISNNSFVPGVPESDGCPQWLRPSAETANYPITCVDWCDAAAYCRAMGKHLCGHLGGGLPNNSDWNNPNKSEWMNACSSDGQHSYPYGDSPSPLTCNGSIASSQDGGSPSPALVASFAGCQSPSSGYQGIWDLSGNVAEWEDNCRPTGVLSESVCRARGGSFMQDGVALSCASSDFSEFERFTKRSYIGFRCCASP